MSSYIYKQKAASTVLSAVSEEFRFVSTTEVTQEMVTEWCDVLQATVSALQALRPVLPTRLLLEAERRPGADLGISVVEIPQ